MNSQRIYLDNAATTRIDDEVLEAMLPYMKEFYGNPSAIHSFGRETRAAIEKARKTIAALLNASTGEIFFTSGGTESNNMAIKCAIQQYNITHIITSPVEHHCVLHAVENCQKVSKVEVHYVELDEKGNIIFDSLEKLLSSAGERCLVSLMHANNEIGNITDIDKASEICAVHDAIFHSDTVQTVGHTPFDLQKTKVHFMSGSAHKFHGPKGVGFIYINSHLKIDSLIHGGGQERNMRAGTENLHGIIGLAKALELACDRMEEDRIYISGLKTYLANRLTESIPGVKINGNYPNDSLYTILNVGFPPNERNETLLFNLDMEGIAASTGSACTSGTEMGSHVMNAIAHDSDYRNIRFSFSKYNTRDELDRVVEVLKEMFLVKA